MGHFFYSLKAFDVLERLDPNPEYWEGKRGASVGAFQKIVAGKEPRDTLREITQMLRNTQVIVMPKADASLNVDHVGADGARPVLPLRHQHLFAGFSDNKHKYTEHAFTDGLSYHLILSRQSQPHQVEYIMKIFKVIPSLPLYTSLQVSFHE